MVRRIFSILIVAALAYGGYAWYRNWWDPADSVSRVGGYISNITAPAREEVSAQADEVVSEAKKSAGEYVSGFIKDTIDSAASYFKDKAIEAVLPSSSSSTVSTSSASSIVPAPAGASSSSPSAIITVAIGNPFIVSVDSGSSYAVNWGDGVTDSGVLSSGSSALVRHSWSVAGNYLVKVIMRGADGTVEETFPVRVTAGN